MILIRKKCCFASYLLVTLLRLRDGTRSVQLQRVQQRVQIVRGSRSAQRIGAMPAGRYASGRGAKQTNRRRAGTAFGSAEQFLANIETAKLLRMNVLRQKKRSENKRPYPRLLVIYYPFGPSILLLMNWTKNAPSNVCSAPAQIVELRDGRERCGNSCLLLLLLEVLLQIRLIGGLVLLHSPAIAGNNNRRRRCDRQSTVVGTVARTDVDCGLLGLHRGSLTRKVPKYLKLNHLRGRILSQMYLKIVVGN